MAMGLGLYDSETGKTLEPTKVVDVSALQSWSDKAFLVYTEAKRGRIVQLQQGCACIHYFYDEPGGQAMIQEDASLRFPNMLAVVLENAPSTCDTCAGVDECAPDCDQRRFDNPID